MTHRDFLSNKLHAHAKKLHEAARCANEQGKFWAFHDTLYAKAPANVVVTVYVYYLSRERP